jgi:hypothetical protein
MVLRYSPPLRRPLLISLILIVLALASAIIIAKLGEESQPALVADSP